MNLIAVDIGNTNINFGLFTEGEIKSVKRVPGDCEEKAGKTLENLWNKLPMLETSKEGKRNGTIVVSSVKPAWTKMLKKAAKDRLREKIYLIGKDISYPMDLSVTEPEKVGSDRVLSAAAAYAVIEQAVVVADLGTAITIDLVDDRGVFVGGTISPGFNISTSALKDSTALLKKVQVTRPNKPFGTTTKEAVNCGVYYSVIGTLQEVIRRYAEMIGTWPRTVITGSTAELVREDCEFIDSYVPNLVIKGIALSYQKFLQERE